MRRIANAVPGAAIAVARVAWLLVLVGGTALGVGRFGARCDACDLVNVAHPYWLGTSVVGLLTLILLRTRGVGRWRFVLIASAVTVVAAVRDPMPMATGCGSVPTAGQLKIVAFNAWMLNPRPEIAAQWILEARPDVIVLVESKGNAARLPDLLVRDYPHQVACLARVPCSTRVLSRLPVTTATPLGQGDVENRQGLSAAAMSLQLSDGQSVTVVGVHMSRLLPLGRQRRELSMLEDRLSAFDRSRMIVAGDFNAPADVTMLRQFAQHQQLGRAQTGSTWPTSNAYPHIPGLLAIDHIFLGRAIGVMDGGVGPSIGSDHRPVFATLCLKTRLAD